MSTLRAALVRQFAKPSGMIGRLAGWIMAHRASNQARNRWMIDLLDLQPTARVLEIGCGPGLALALAADRARDGFVTGVDHSAEMVAMARRRLEAPIAQGRAEAIPGDDRALEAFDAALDAVFSANVIQFLPDRPGYFESAFNGLAPGGRIATTFQPRGEAPTVEQADAMAESCERFMRDAGFEAIRTERLEGFGLPAVCILGQRPRSLTFD